MTHAHINDSRQERLHQTFIACNARICNGRGNMLRLYQTAYAYGFCYLPCYVEFRHGALHEGVRVKRFLSNVVNPLFGPVLSCSSVLVFLRAPACVCAPCWSTVPESGGPWARPSHKPVTNQSQTQSQTSHILSHKPLYTLAQALRIK